MSTLEPAIRDRVGAWEYLLRQALDLERWGQQLEALELYEKMSIDVDKTITLNQSAAATARTAMMKFSQCVHGRVARLRNPRAAGLETEAMVKLNANFMGLFTGAVPFPIEIGALKVDTKGPAPVVNPDRSATAEPADVKVGTGTLLPPPKVGRGDVIARLTVEKIGLKDAPTYLEPFVTISLRDANGKDIETPQDTPTTTKRDGTYITFDCGVYLQTPISRIPEGANIFLEFKHWKAKEKKYSVRCWSMISKAELAEGPACQEVYAKPTDYLAKKFTRHSSKDLFLHTSVTLVSN